MATRNVASVEAMKAVLEREVPVGTQGELAKCFMEREGFKCSNTQIGAKTDGKASLYCDRTDSFEWLVNRRWQVQLVLLDDTVSELTVSMDYVGL